MERFGALNDGTRLYYELTGQCDPTLVFIHGWCSNLTHWNAQVRHFAPRHRVLALDRRGHGRSDVTDSGYTPQTHSDDLAQVMQAEALRDAIVVGHAGGGPTAVQFAHDHPALARALVLVDTNISPHTPLGGDGAPRSPLGQLVDNISGDKGAANFAAMYRTFFSADAGEIADRAVAEATRVPLAVAQAELASLAADSEGAARTLSLPVLWITATNADEQRLSSIFAKVQFGRVVGSGHFPHLEVPDQLNAMLERFIASLPIRKW